MQLEGVFDCTVPTTQTAPTCQTTSDPAQGHSQDFHQGVLT